MLILDKTGNWRVFHSDQVLKQAIDQAASTGLVSVRFVKLFCLVTVDAKKNEKRVA